MRRQNWSRDETILALDFYYAFSPSIPDKTSKKIEGITRSLNKVREKLEGSLNANHRSPHSVHMKMYNFCHLDPNYPGNGLYQASNLDKDVFREFKDDIPKLHKI